MLRAESQGGYETMEIYVHDGEEQTGPYNPLMLRAALSSGDLQGDHFCWHEGLTDWTALKETEFADALPGAKPAAPVLDVTPAAASLTPETGFTPEKANAQMKELASELPGHVSKSVQASPEEAEPESASKKGMILMLCIVTGGFVSLLAGGVWIAFVLTTGVLWGWIAALVGVACGMAVSLVKGDRIGPEYSLIASMSALVGILLGYYVIYVEFWRAYLDYEGEATKAAELSVFSPFTAIEVFSHFGELFHPLDLLFVGFAIFAAWGAAGGSGLQQQEEE